MNAWVPKQRGPGGGLQWPPSHLEPDLFQEREEPHVDCYECEVDVSPSRTGAFSLTSGDLGDLSSFSSKASGPQHTSSGGSSALSATRSRANSAGPRRGSQDSALPTARKPRWVGALRDYLPVCTGVGCAILGREKVS